MKLTLIINGFMSLLLTVSYLSSKIIVDGYVLNGGEWECNRLHYLGWYVTDNSVYRNEIRNHVGIADNEWNGVIIYEYEERPRFYEQSYRPYEYAVIFIDLEYLPIRSILGVTDLRILNGEIYLAYVTFNQGPYIGGYYIDDNHFRHVVNHELGHVLGLGHESRHGPTVLMYPNDAPYTDNDIWYPTIDEINGVNYLYSPAGCHV